MKAVVTVHSINNVIISDNINLNSKRRFNNANDYYK